MNFLKIILLFGLTSANIKAKPLNKLSVFTLWKKKIPQGKQTMKIIEDGKTTNGSLAWNLSDNESWEMEFYGKHYTIINSKLYWRKFRIPAIGFIKLLTYPINDWKNHLEDIKLIKKNNIVTLTCKFEKKTLIIKMQIEPNFKLLYLLANETEFKFD